MRTDRGVLPGEDPRQTSNLLQRAIEAVEADKKSEAEQILKGVVETEMDSLCQVIPSLIALVVTVLTSVSSVPLILQDGDKSTQSTMYRTMVPSNHTTRLSGYTKCANQQSLGALLSF